MHIRPAAIALVLAAAPAARADSWIGIETPAAIAVSDAQSHAFRPGVLPAAGGYLGMGPIAFGARLRLGVLRDGPAPANAVDPGTGGLASTGLALRGRYRGAWVELVAGAAVTGHDVAPSFEAGAGWSFDVGPVAVGPSVRWLHVSAPPTMNLLGSADLALAGIEVVVARSHPSRPRIAPVEPVVRVERVETVVPVVVPPPPPPPAPPAPSLADDLAACEACVPAEIQVEHDRLVLDDRVLFDFARTRVRRRGQEVIAAIMKLWSAHPEWVRITVEGHTDSVGTPAFNLALSEARANRVRDLFVELGADASRIDAVGYGEDRPRDTGLSDEARQRNRRVEFRIEREVKP